MNDAAQYDHRRNASRRVKVTLAAYFLGAVVFWAPWNFPEFVPSSSWRPWADDLVAVLRIEGAVSMGAVLWQLIRLWRMLR